MTAPTPIERALCCGATCGRHKPEHGECQASTYGRRKVQALEAASYRVVSAADLDRHDARVTELLLANNAEVERRRRAEAANG